MNFAILRRHLGVPRADLLTREVASRLVAALPGVRAMAVGRATLQLEFEAEHFRAGESMLAGAHGAMRVPFDFEGEQHVVELVFGGSVSAGGERDPVRLLEAAELTLHDAVALGRDTLRPVSDDAFGDPAALMRDLPGAIASAQLFLQYQPKVNVRRQEVASAEALIRWRHPDRGLILPGDFIETAERFGLIGQLTLWTLRKVIEDQRRLAAVGHDLRLFLNISGLLLSDPAFVEAAMAEVAGQDVKLGFEVTETAVIRDPESAIRHLRAFAAAGIEIAIDDYGAGLSSLAYLKRLPASELKIDKLFVTQLTSSNRDPLIVRSTIDLAHALDMKVTAEGVETPAALALLSVMGCDVVQGYLLSRPIEFDAFRHFLDDKHHIEQVTAPRPAFGRTEGFWRTG